MRWFFWCFLLVPTFFYRETVSPPFHYLNVHTQVYKATMVSFRGHEEQRYGSVFLEINRGPV